MQVATITLALGGDVGNTIQKYSVTPSEVAVLQQIHGNESVTEIAIYEKPVQRTSRAERERLARSYGKNQPDGSARAEAVDALFPGVAARLYENFDELPDDNVPENFFKAKPKQAAEEEVDTPALDLKKMSKTQLLTLAEKSNVVVSESDTKAEIIAALQADAEAKADDDDGGIGDVDNNMFQ